MWDESSVSDDDGGVIPSQHKVTQQVPSHWQPFLDLKLMFPGSRHAEQISLHSQRIVATVEVSVLRSEIADFESQEEDDPKSIHFFKPMSWLGQIRPPRSRSLLKSL